MDCLYEISSKLTYEEYKRFSIRLGLKKLLIGCSVLIAYALLASIFWLGFKGSVLVWIIAIVGIVFIWVIYLMRLKRAYNSSPISKNASILYEFYEDNYKVISDGASSNIQYNKLYKIVETKTNFYLMFARNAGSILIKEELPEGLDIFLREIKEKHSL